MPTLHIRLKHDTTNTPTYYSFSESPEESQALPNGERALTPIIAGSVSGALVVLGWAIAAIVIIVKRRNRKQLLAKEGRLDQFNEAPKTEPFILPPDPAVVEGIKQPGEFVNVQKEKHRKGKEKESSMLAPPPLPPRTKSMPVEHMRLRDVVRTDSARTVPTALHPESNADVTGESDSSAPYPHDFAYRSKTSAFTTKPG